MSELVCIAFQDSSTADRVLNELRAMETNYIVDLEDAVIVVRDMDGKVHLKQCVDVFGGATTHGVALGMLWGGLMGLLFMNPLAGLLGSLAGGAGGGAMTVAASDYGLLSDYGIPDNFIKQVGGTITPGTSAIFLLIRSADQDKLLAEFSQHEGTILKTSMSQEQEEKLRTVLTHQHSQKTSKG
ncbi:MAG: DUF1269 domain-containing protein [Nitrospira sp.]|nr:DUF1269 domain-containing protein [Nitrospira sp.]MBH0183486.1 DUF1269 domain-containing protein [Nitrospira sp.]MBH0186792.1 DUF1269 domain-containing protein [Nitrospira sp.]